LTFESLVDERASSGSVVAAFRFSLEREDATVFAIRPGASCFEEPGSRCGFAAARFPDYVENMDLGRADPVLKFFVLENPIPAFGPRILVKFQKALDVEVGLQSSKGIRRLIDTSRCNIILEHAAWR
jgi:hypothetical protein